LKAKELVYSEFPVISGARKKSHLACNHEAQISPYLWRGALPFLRSFLITPPLRFADDQRGVYGKRISRRCLLRNLSFLPGPWQAFMKNMINGFGDEPHILGSAPTFLSVSIHSTIRIVNSRMLW
jgi:hypothetical protein